ncbi:MAG TPA: HEAT repeat domain-containing protein [Thermoguttaceae bacterium]|nr:HEAT repeat domain-containing protein [Thermoguttaceae bacterium]
MRPINHHLTLIFAACLFAALSPPLLAQQPPPAEGTQSELLAVLQSDAPLFDKAKACQQLAVVGTKDAVPVLARLLADETLAHYARFALEPIPDPAVDEALRAAMGRLEGKLLVGVINSIGMRRDAAAADGLGKLLSGSDADVAAAAASALGRIGSLETARTLQAALTSKTTAPPAVLGDACLTCAVNLLEAGQREQALALYGAVQQADVPKHVKIAALHGEIGALGPRGLPRLVECLRSDDKATFQVGLRMARELPGDAVTEALIEELPKLAARAGGPADARQALVIHVLGARGSGAALPVVLEAARNGAAETRLAAVQVLADLGDATAVPVLLAATEASDEDLARAARESLTELSGAEVDAALAAMLPKSEGPTRSMLIGLVGGRGIVSAVPALLKAADDNDQEIRLAAIEALGFTVGPDDLPALIGRLVGSGTPEVTAATKEALRKACLRMPDRDACAAQLLERMPTASTSGKSDLLDLLGELGGTKALEGVSAAAGDGDEAVQDAATRVLGEWMSPDAAPVLLELATAGNDKFKIRCLRGYIRIARQLDVPLAERITMCRQALDIAPRDDEKKLVLDVLALYPSPESLSLVVPYLDNAGLKEAASTAAVAIAEKILDPHPAPVAEAMQKTIEATGDADLAARAKRLLRQAKAKSP